MIWFKLWLGAIKIRLICLMKGIKMSYKLYQVAVLELPKKVKDEEEGMPKVILEPTSILARNDQDAAIKIAMKFASKLAACDQEMLEVVVRPF